MTVIFFIFPLLPAYLIPRGDSVKKLDIIMILAAILVAVGVGLGVFFYRTIPTLSWGLSFRQEGAPPVGNASEAALRQYDAWYLGDTGKMELCLTFDAGYENGCTEQILDILKKHEVKAAFFLVGNYIEKNADLVRRMAAEGHTVGNHTLHHPDMSAISDPASFRSELQGLEDLYEKTVGKPLPKYYRPPQGTFSEENLKQAKALGYKTIFWSLAYVDWNNNSQPDPKESIEKLCTRIHPGAVVLLHSTSQTNARILDELLTKWKDMGYSFITLEELTAS